MKSTCVVSELIKAICSYGAGFALERG
jgi:hypothetical protein